MTSAIAQKVDATPWIDTHEHLIEETRRLSKPADNDWLFPCDDWAYLFYHYTADDLHVAGMSREDVGRFLSPRIEPEDKWPLLAPYWPRVRHTGYGRAVLITLRELFGEEDVSASNVARITSQLRAGARPGFYRRILQDVAGIEACHVNSLEDTFCQTAQPDLLYQDLSTANLSSGPDLAVLRHDTGLPVRTLEECCQAVDWYFDRYAAQAVATKDQSAYGRRLDYAAVAAEDAASVFRRHAGAGAPLTAGELKPLQDYLWRYAVTRATGHGLPVKLHTGYYAGSDTMPLDRVSLNLKDLCPILLDFPTTRFVLMHIAYPYHDELAALAKQYANVYVDLCWAWIVNPVAAKNFVKDFLMAAPCNKLLAFGGDFFSVENVVGHARIARMGLARALEELVAEHWITEQEALDLVEPLMRGNAWELFDMEHKREKARSLLRL